MHPALAPLTIPLSKVYGVAIKRRNARFDRGIGVTTLDRPVISIGNITTGGTGKSPMVAWVCRTLLDAGHQPLIAMRGYAAGVDGLSDEAAEYREQFGEAVGIAVGADRISAITRYREAHDDVDCVVLDDGFQHRQIARDLDVVLVDASRKTFAEHLLPAGHLREPPSALARADAVVVTHIEQATEAFLAAIQTHHGRQPIALTRHVWSALTVHDAAVTRQVSPTVLDGMRLATCFGTGNPRSVERNVQLHGGILTARVPARDHQQYDARLLARLRAACDRAAGVRGLVVTPKDWTKLSRVIEPGSWPVPIFVPTLQLKFVEGESAFAALVRRIAAGESESGV